MAKQRSRSVLKMIGEAVEDVVDATSVAATGSQLGVLELAAEEELRLTPAKRSRKAKLAQKKKKTGTKSKKNKTKKSHGGKRSRR